MIDPATWPRNTFPRNHALVGEGYRLLEDFERLERGDETACISTLTSTQCHEGWRVIDGLMDNDIGKTIGELTQWGSLDIDHMERIFRRRSPDSARA